MLNSHAINDNNLRPIRSWFDAVPPSCIVDFVSKQIHLSRKSDEFLIVWPFVGVRTLQCSAVDLSFRVEAQRFVAHSGQLGIRRSLDKKRAGFN